MTPLFIECDPVEIYHLGEEGVLRKFRSATTTVLAMHWPRLDVVTFVAIASKSRIFGQDYWLGSAQERWRLIYGLHQENLVRMRKALRFLRLPLTKIPSTLLNFCTGPIADAQPRTPMWDRDVFQTFVVPVEAATAARDAIRASSNLVERYLRPPNLAPPEDQSRYGNALLERVFKLQHYFYAKPRIMQRWGHVFRIDLDRLLADIAEASRLSHADWPHHVNGQWLVYQPLDGREYDASDAGKIRQANLQRAVLLARLALPHFYRSAKWRSINTGRNHPQTRYALFPNDLDWVEALHAVSPDSFSSDFAEHGLLLGYIADMERQFPCLATDPLRKVLPRVTTWHRKPNMQKYEPESLVYYAIRK